MSESSAVISECGQYRYRLERSVSMEGITIGFFGVNPSTADAIKNDATVRKWIGFSVGLGARRFIVGNVFGYRSKKVAALKTAEDPVGPENVNHLSKIIQECDLLIPCWGCNNKIPAPLHWARRNLTRMLLSSGKPVKCWGVTDSGGPRHPLMLGYDTPLVDYAPTDLEPISKWRA